MSKYSEQLQSPYKYYIKSIRDDEVELLGEFFQLAHIETAEKVFDEDGESAKTIGTEYALLQDRYVNKKISHLMGEILTIIEASSSNEKQQKAIKDIIRSKFKNTLDRIHSDSNKCC